MSRADHQVARRFNAAARLAIAGLVIVALIGVVWFTVSSGHDAAPDDGRLRSGYGAEPERSLTSEKQASVDRVLAEASPSDIRIEVTSRELGQPLAEVSVIAEQPWRVISRSDVSGVVMVPWSMKGKECWVYADGRAIEQIAVESDAAITLAECPVISCVLQDVDLETALGYQFVAKSLSPNQNCIEEIGRLVGGRVGHGRMWNGLGSCDVRASCFGSCDIVVVATGVNGESVAQSVVSLAELAAWQRIDVSFEPRLPAARVNVRFCLRCIYDSEVAIEAFVTGPVDSSSGRPVAGMGRTYSGAGVTNSGVVFSEAVAPGRYTWGVLVLGVGTFDLGTLLVPNNGGDVTASAALQLVECTIRVSGVDREVDIRVWDGFSTVSGEVLPEADMVKGYGECKVMLPKGRVLFASAIVRDPWRVAAPVRIPTTYEGSIVEVSEWLEFGDVRFDIAGEARVLDLQCVEIKHMESGMLRTSDWTLSSTVGPFRFVYGSYKARVRAGSSVGPWIDFNIPNSATVVLTH